MLHVHRPAPHRHRSPPLIVDRHTIRHPVGWAARGRTIGPIVRLVLYDIPDEEALSAALRGHARRVGSRALCGPPVLVEPGRLPEPPGVVDGGPGTARPWLWTGDAASLRAAATEVLRCLVFPITHAPGSFCLAFPFSADALDARPLGPSDTAGLDLEDIGRLLADVGDGPAVNGASSSAPSSGLRPAVQQDLDALQRRAVDHRGGALRVLAPAGSGKTKTMINRVAALVADGVPPGSIIVVAFNTKAAEQLEERLGRLGVPTTRRVQDDSGVHCATFNAFGYRYQREVMQAAPQVSDDAAERARLMRAAVWAALTECGDAGGLLPGGPPQRGREAAALDDLVWRALDARAEVHAALSDPASMQLPLPPFLAAGRAGSLPFGEVERRFSAAQRRRSVQAFDDQISQAVLDLLARSARRQRSRTATVTSWSTSSRTSTRLSLRSSTSSRDPTGACSWSETTTNSSTAGVSRRSRTSSAFRSACRWRRIARRSS